MLDNVRENEFRARRSSVHRGFLFFFLFFLILTKSHYKGAQLCSLGEKFISIILFLSFFYFRAPTWTVARPVSDSEVCARAASSAAVANGEASGHAAAWKVRVSTISTRGGRGA